MGCAFFSSRAPSRSAPPLPKWARRRKRRMKGRARGLVGIRQLDTGRTAQQWRHRGQRQTSIATMARKIGTVDQGMARLAGKRTGGNIGVAIVAGTGSPPTGAPLLWTGRLRQESAAVSRIHAAYPETVMRTATPGQLTTALSVAARR